MTRKEFEREARKFHKDGRCLIHCEYNADEPNTSFSACTGDARVMFMALAHTMARMSRQMNVDFEEILNGVRDAYQLGEYKDFSNRGTK